jgi:hypothetical protein
MSMVHGTGAMSRRHLLGAGVAAGAASLVAGPVGAAGAATATPPAPPGEAAGLAVSSIFYPGIQLTAGHPTATCGLQFISDTAQGSFPSISGGFVGTPLAVPAGSFISQVVFFLYQLQGQQRCDVQIYKPGAAGSPVVVSSSVTGTGIITKAYALNHTLAPSEAIAAFSWGGGWAPGTYAVCRGIRVDYVVPGLAGASGDGSFVPIVPVRVYDSRLSDGPLRDGEERVVSVATSTTGQRAIPPGVRAVALSVTVTETTGSGGYVAVFPAGTTWSSTSSVNWFGAGQNLATAVLCGVDGASRVTVRGGVNPTQVVLDATGYFA